MMKVVGEEGTSMDDFVVYLKGEYLDASYLQQDAYHDIDAATPADRQQHVFAAVHRVLKTKMAFPDKDQARRFFQRLVQATNDWNRTAFQSPEFAAGQRAIEALVRDVTAPGGHA
jgi:V/A-type H+-transporting ATPase subunit A